MREGLLIVISGPGAVGKDTLIQKLRELEPGVVYSVSYTTRPKRDYERNDVHYTFVTPKKFKELIGSGELLEHAEINGHLYGTSRTRVEESQKSGRDVILKIDVRGAEQVREKRPDGIFIFLAPPSLEELMRRRKERGSESPEEMEQRQRLAQWELDHAQYYDYVVVNDDIDRAARDVLRIIEQERRRRSTEAAS